MAIQFLTQSNENLLLALDKCKTQFTVLCNSPYLTFLVCADTKESEEEIKQFKFNGKELFNFGLLKRDQGANEYVLYNLINQENELFNSIVGKFAGGVFPAIEGGGCVPYYQTPHQSQFTPGPIMGCVGSMPFGAQYISRNHSVVLFMAKDLDRFMYVLNTYITVFKMANHNYTAGYQQLENQLINLNLKVFSEMYTRLT